MSFDREIEMLKNGGMLSTVNEVKARFIARELKREGITPQYQEIFRNYEFVGIPPKFVIWIKKCS